MPMNRITKPQKASSYLLSAEFCLPSSKKLRNAIEKISGKHYPITTKDRFAPTAIARYGGNAMPLFGDTDNNSIERINLLSNKLAFSQALIRQGFYAPRFCNIPTDITSFPVLVRNTLTSFGGRGIHVCRTQAEVQAAWRSGSYWTPFVRMHSEYRVHIAGGEILKIFEKVREDTLEEEEFPIRNNDRGYHFSLQSKPRCGNSIRTIVKELSEKLPILSTGFFALDIGWVAEEKRIFFIEGNSAPGLNESTAELYAKYILGIKTEVATDEILRPVTHTS